MSNEYCVNCKYGTDTDFCRKDLKTELHVHSKACQNFIKSKIKPSDPEIVSALGKYTNNMQLAEEMQKVAPIYYDESRNFWLWKKLERYYKRIDETDILNATHQNSGEYVIDSTTKKEIIEGIKMTGRQREVKPIPKTWIHTADQVIDYKTKESIKATPEYFFTSPIPHKLGLDEDTPTIDKLFKDWVGDRSQILYEILAYCLIDDYPIHRMFVLFGSGRNGKSQFLELITRFIGIKNTTSTELEKVIDSRFEAAKLYRKKAALIGETNFTAIKSSDRIKKLCGHDMLTAEYKNKDPFDFQNTAKIVIATNSIPETLDKTEAFHSRVIIIEFKNRFDEGVSVIDTIPEPEYENLLLKSVNLLSGLLEKGKFTNEGTIEEKAVNYERLSNPFPTFKNKELIENPDVKIPTWIIRDLYISFCAKNGFRKVGEREFSQLLKHDGYEVRSSWWGKKNWSTVFGLTTKEPYVYEEIDNANNSHDEGDEVLKGDVSNSSLYGEEVKTSPSSPSSPSKAEQLDNKSITDSITEVLPKTSQETELTILLKKAKSVYEQKNGPVNSLNINRFSFEFCKIYNPKWVVGKETGDYTPSGIKAIASKLFYLTPEAGHQA